MPRWSAEEQEIGAGRRYRLRENGAALARGRLFTLLATDEDFADWYTDTLSRAPCEAYYWETPPLDDRGLGQAAEFVLIDAPELARPRPDPMAFREHFGAATGDGIASFPNLGGDALLIVPEPRAEPEAYPHLAAFLRRGPADQVRALWRVTAECVRERIGRSPFWLSTSGTGIAWLHVRLDRRPKYYQYLPYRSAP